MNNRLYNCKNPYQGKAKRVLCVCSAGLLRSPTAAIVLQREYGYNTRAAGIEESFALIPVDEVLIEWAEEIVCMSKQQETMLRDILKQNKIEISKKIICLNIDDDYEYMNPGLINSILESYKKCISK